MRDSVRWEAADPGPAAASPSANQAPVQGLRAEFRPGSPSASLPPGNRFEGVWVMPGKIAGAHRHSAAALRLMIEGRGGYTVVNGKRGRQGSKSATMGGQAGNRHRIRRSGASRWPAAAPKRHVEP